MVRIKRFRYNLHEILYRKCGPKSNGRMRKTDTILMFSVHKIRMMLVSFCGLCYDEKKARTVAG